MKDEDKSFFISENREGETKKEKYARWEKERLAKIREEELNKKDITYDWEEDSVYSIKISSYLQLGEGKINETEINRKWKINYKEKLQQIDLEEIEYHNSKIDSQLKPLYEITEIINKATQYMTLQLDKEKTICGIPNIREIRSKWEDIKNNELKLKELLNEAYQQLIKMYDKQFDNLVWNIRINLLYQIFFFPFSKIRYEQEKYLPLMERTTVSLLFPGEMLNYKLFYRSRIIEEDFLFVYIKSEPGGNYSKSLQESYEEKYKKALEADFDYHFFTEGEYVHRKGGYLDHATFYFKEKVNKKMQYVSKYEIKRIEPGEEK